MSPAERVYRARFGELCRIVTGQCPQCGVHNYARVDESLANLCGFEPPSDRTMALAALGEYGSLSEMYASLPIPCSNRGCSCEDIPNWHEVRA